MLITPFEASDLSAPLKYSLGSYLEDGRRRPYFVWLDRPGYNGPVGQVQATNSGRWRGRRISCTSVGTFYGPWLGSFGTRALAAHAALVDKEPVA